MRSQLFRSVGLVGLLAHESTDHFEGIAPVPLGVRPEPRWPGSHYRSPTLAGCQHRSSFDVPVAGQMPPLAIGHLLLVDGNGIREYAVTQGEGKSTGRHPEHLPDLLKRRMVSVGATKISFASWTAVALMAVTVAQPSTDSTYAMASITRKPHRNARLRPHMEPS